MEWTFPVTRNNFKLTSLKVGMHFGCRETKFGWFLHFKNFFFIFVVIKNSINMAKKRRYISAPIADRNPRNGQGNVLRADNGIPS